MCEAIYQAAWAPVFSEDALQQLRSCVSDFRLIADIPGSGHRDPESDDSRHFVERSQMLPRDSEDVEPRQVSRFAPGFHIELRPDADYELCSVTFRRKHPVRKSRLPVCTAST
jgi:hypothetical protein